MGTNFYLYTKNKELKNMYFQNAKLIDEPEFGYEIHIAKTSCGWLPIFEAYNGWEKSSVKELLGILAKNEKEITIKDEYGKKYSLEAFIERVVKFNGGYKGGIPEQEYIQDKDSPFYDENMPDTVPVSHIEYGNGKYADYYFRDEEGYEFMEGDFS